MNKNHGKDGKFTSGSGSIKSVSSSMKSAEKRNKNKLENNQILKDLQKKGFLKR